MAGDERSTPESIESGVFVTGTGTEVGKTVVAAVIAHTLAAKGLEVNVFKPAVSGLEEGGEADHELLRRAAGSSQSDEEIAPYRYQAPVSPHLGAELAGERIDPERLRTAAHAAAADADELVCEGVGGLLVPLVGRVTRQMREKVDPRPYLVRDFAVDLGLPLVIVAAPGLGTINHTLLTIEAAQSAGLEIAAVVLTPWPEEPSEIERSNRETIGSLGEVRTLVLPGLDRANPDSWPPLAP